MPACVPGTRRSSAPWWSVRGGPGRGDSGRRPASNRGCHQHRRDLDHDSSGHHRRGCGVGEGPALRRGTRCRPTLHGAGGSSRGRSACGPCGSGAARSVSSPLHRSRLPPASGPARTRDEPIRSDGRIPATASGGGSAGRLPMDRSAPAGGAAQGVVDPRVDRRRRGRRGDPSRSRGRQMAGVSAGRTVSRSRPRGGRWGARHRLRRRPGDDGCDVSHEGRGGASARRSLERPRRSCSGRPDRIA